MRTAAVFVLFTLGISLPLTLLAQAESPEQQARSRYVHRLQVSVDQGTDPAGEVIRGWHGQYTLSRRIVQDLYAGLSVGYYNPQPYTDWSLCPILLDVSWMPGPERRHLWSFRLQGGYALGLRNPDLEWVDRHEGGWGAQGSIGRVWKAGRQIRISTEIGYLYQKAALKYQTWGWSDLRTTDHYVFSRIFLRVGLLF